MSITPRVPCTAITRERGKYRGKAESDFEQTEALIIVIRILLVKRPRPRGGQDFLLEKVVKETGGELIKSLYPFVVKLKV